jgi:hypothetical protein
MRKLSRLILGGLVVAIAHAPAVGQTARQWTSEDGVVAVTIPESWQETKQDEIAAMKLSISPPGEHATAACGVTVNTMKGRAQEGSNNLATALVTTGGKPGKMQYSETYVGPVRVAMSLKVEDNGDRSLTRFLSISDASKGTGYMLTCLANPEPAETYAQVDAFMRSLTVHGETPK